LCWSADNQSILYCSGSYLTIKPLRVEAKQTKWKAHDSTVLKVDWNPVNNLIVSGAEDCKYKVWDSYGRQLYCSKPTEFPITAVSWCPNGDYFAVGSFNVLSLCDKTGWAHSRSRVNSGSILSVDWTSDGTHLAGAGASGAVCFGQVVDRSLEWKNFEVMLNEKNQVIVHDVLNDNKAGEELEFAHRVIGMSMNYGYLIVVTAKTCSVFSSSNFSTPHIFDLKGTVTLIVQSPAHFLLVDNVSGLSLYSYEGRSLSQGLKIPSSAASVSSASSLQYLQPQQVALSSDCLAIIDRANPKQVLVLDALTGKPLADPIKHDLEILEIGLKQSGLISSRTLYFIDRNRDLHLAQLHRAANFKLATMVDTAMWHESVELLAAVVDHKLNVWCYPHAAYVDRDLVQATKIVIDNSHFHSGAQLTSFSESRCTVRRSDGALTTLAFSPYPSMLYRFVQAGQWTRATRLCRFVKDDVLWTCLAVMAINGEQLDTAEVALAAINEVDKLQYIQYIKTLPSQESRSAELYLYRRQPDSAEGLLLQSKLIYRAIKLNIARYRWDRALDLALQYKTHVDTVLMYRMHYLASISQAETIPRFIDLASKVNVDPAAVAAKENQEREAERKRGTPYESKTGFVLEQKPLRDPTTITTASPAPSSITSPPIAPPVSVTDEYAAVTTDPGDDLIL